MKTSEGGQMRPIMKITSPVFTWDPDDDVGEDFSRYFEEAVTGERWQGGLPILHLRLRPGYTLSDLGPLRGLSWDSAFDWTTQEDSLIIEIPNNFILEKATPNSDNPFLDETSCEFEYRVELNLELTDLLIKNELQSFEPNENFVDLFCKYIALGVFELLPGMEVDNHEADTEQGYIRIEIIEFMGETYDMVVGDGGS